MNKKLIIIGGLLVLFIIILVLFLLTSNKNSKKTTAPSSNKLVIWDSFDTEDNFTTAITKYKNANPGMEVDFVKKNPATYETDSINALASGQGPDIWIIPSNWMSKHHNKLAALEDKKLDPAGKKDNASAYKDTFLPVVNQDNVFDNQVYGIPLFVDSLSLFYNTSLLNEKYQQYIKDHPDVDTEKVRAALVDPPKTWDDLAEQIKLYGQNAIALGSSSNIDRSSDILTALLMQYGAQMTSDDQTAALFHTANNLINPDIAYPGAKALTFYTSFAKPGDVHNTWDKNSDNAYQQFIKGTLPMMVDYNQIAKKVEKDMGNAPSVAKLPQQKNTEKPTDLAYYQTLTVPKGGINTAKAWSFITFITSDPEILAKYLTDKGVASALKSETQNSQNFLDVQNNYSQSWYNPEPTKTSQIFKTAIDQALDGQSPQTVLEGAAADITKLLKDLKEQK